MKHKFNRNSDPSGNIYYLGHFKMWTERPIEWLRNTPLLELRKLKDNMNIEK